MLNIFRKIPCVLFLGRCFKIAAVGGVFCSLSWDCSAQYFQFSQYNFTEQRINPAMTGSTHYATLDVDSRSQKTGGDFNINSNFFSLSYPLLNPSTGYAFSGIGISVLDDHSAGVFKKQEAALTYAAHIRINRYQQFSLGFKALYQSQQINADGFTTGSQYTGDHFDPGLSSGESFQTGRAHYTTFSAGLYWQGMNKRGDVVAHWGLTVFDINKPSVSFLGTPVPVPASFVFTGAFQAWHNSENSISPELLFTNSSGTNVVNAGARLRHFLKASPNQTPDKIDLITKYVVGRSGILGIQLHREFFSFGVSYDFPVVKTNPGNLGAIELGLTLRRLVETKNKKTARKRQLEKQKAVAKAPRKIPAKIPAANDSIPLPEVQIVKTDTAGKSRQPNGIQTNAVAGGVLQDPMVLEKITLHFHFDYNSVDLDDETEDYLQMLGQSLKDDPTLSITITGHTDNIGTEKFNQKLSQRRADAIRNYLIRDGIETSRIESIGKGLSEPLNDNDTEANQAKNRRVEIVVFKK